LEQIARKVRPLVEPAGLKVDQSMIYKIEQGRVPSWPMVAALSQVYKTDIRETVLQLMQTLEFPGAGDLLCQTDGAESASRGWRQSSSDRKKSGRAGELDPEYATPEGTLSIGDPHNVTPAPTRLTPSQQVDQMFADTDDIEADEREQRAEQIRTHASIIIQLVDGFRGPYRAAPPPGGETASRPPSDSEVRPRRTGTTKRKGHR
jgi:hypothetical protein